MNGQSGQDRLANYVDVDVRVKAFYTDYPNGGIVTDLMHWDEQRIIVRAEVRYTWSDERPASSGYAEELRGSTPVNRTSAIENGETSAVGRALANLGYSGDKRLGFAKRPSLQEMEGVARKEAVLAERERPRDVVQLPPQPAAAAPTPIHPNGAAHPPAAPNPHAATDAQVRYVRSLSVQYGLNTAELDQYIGNCAPGQTLATLTRGGANQVIEALKADLQKKADTSTTEMPF